jgi:hypothetical protein
MQAHEARQRPGRLLALDVGIVLGLLDQLVIGLVSLLSSFSLPCSVIRSQKASNCLLASLKGTVLLFSQRLIVEKLTPSSLNKILKLYSIA